jgi:hypothetical protein
VRRGIDARPDVQTSRRRAPHPHDDDDDDAYEYEREYEYEYEYEREYEREREAWRISMRTTSTHPSIDRSIHARDCRLISRGMNIQYT